MLLLPFAFYSGLMTILAPSIWPLLPLILSSSVEEHQRFRPLGITLGVVTSFAIFALVVSTTAASLDINPDLFHSISAIILMIIGTLLIWPEANLAIQNRIKHLASFTQNNERTWDDGFVGGIITGAVLGFVWSPFAGTVLESLTRVARSEDGFAVYAATAAYALGIAVPLLAIAYGGQRLFRPSSKHIIAPRTLQIFFGVFTLLIAFAMVFNLDRLLTSTLWNIIK